MRYALIGKNISHSYSPELYKKLISPDISYELIDISKEADLPNLSAMEGLFSRINITSPYKRSYFSSVIVEQPEAIVLGAINTISHTQRGWVGFNSDLLAVEFLLIKFRKELGDLHLIVLGDGVMAQLTSIVARKLNLSLENLNRKNGLVSDINLRSFHKEGASNLIINACSRDFTFSGELNETDIFWDYNYNLKTHQETLPLKAKKYIDGFELLELQAAYAIQFWNSQQ